MKLHVFPPSPNGKKVMMAAAEAGVAPEIVIVDLQKGEQMAPAFLALNPNGKMPVLEYGDGTSLWESNAIANRLGAMGESSIWPKSDLRYEILQWQFWEMAHWQPATAKFVGAHFFNAPLDRETAEPALAKLAAVLDSHLAGRDWLVGDSLTTADIAVAINLCYRDLVGIPLGDVPNIDRWMARIAERPTWAEVNRVPEAA